MLEKFGLSDCSLDNILWNLFWMMRTITINIDSRIRYRSSLIHYAICFICVSSYIYTYFFCMIYNLLWVYPQTKDVTAAIIIVSLGFSSEISTMKLILVFVLRKRITRIVDRFRELDSKIDSNSRFSKNTMKQLRVVKKRALIFYIMFSVCSFTYLMLPAMTPGRNLPENSLRMFGLEPMFESPNYEIAYTINVLAGIMATVVPVHVTILLIVLSGYIEARITGLAQEFSALWNDTLSIIDLDSEQSEIINNYNDQLNEIIKMKLRSLVKIHGEFIILLKEVKDIFKNILAIEFILTMIAMCAVLLGGLEDTYLQIPYTVIQLFFDSVLGQRLLDSSKLFETSVFHCGWENFNYLNMKTIQIVLQCSQKELNLSAADVTTLSFESCMYITKSVYSAYATLTKAMK